MRRLTFLERLKPYLLAMSLDYSVVPKCDIDIMISLFAVAGGHPARDASGHIDVSITNALNKAEGNVGHDAVLGGIQIAPITINGSAEGNVGHDATGLDVDTSLTNSIYFHEAYGRQIEPLEAMFGTFLEALATTTTGHELELVEAFAETENHVTAQTPFSKEITAEHSTTLDLTAVAQVFKEAIKEIQNATSIWDVQPSVEIVATPTAQVLIEQHTPFEVYGSMQRTNGKRAILTKEQNIEMTIAIQRLRKSMLTEMAGHSIKSIFENKTIERALLISV